VLYHLHDYHRALFNPATVLAQATARMFSQLPGAAPVAAGYELFYRLGKRYEKPLFGIDAVDVRGTRVRVVEETVLARPFCRLQRFTRLSDQPDVAARLKDDPVVLVVAPLSGHHATLLREAIASLLAGHAVYVTDWLDARMVPLREGGFSLDDYVGYLGDFVRHIGTERLHVLAVCQPAVPVLAAAALSAAAGHPQPRSLILMGGPIDARRNPTQVNRLATSKPLRWFETHLLHDVPAHYPGRGRRVYPGFLQHASFIAMNPVRHMNSHIDFFHDLVLGDARGAEEHRRFYDEYNAVLDMPAEYYLDCVRIVFQQHLLPRGRWHVGGARVEPAAITDAALMTIEGELDDISGPDQTRAAHDLCTGIPDDRKRHLTVRGAGHYGIFSGRRWREIVHPRMRDFIAAAEATCAR
jgi:poly(3-hydroxybutyrate) depolymerase